MDNEAFMNLMIDPTLNSLTTIKQTTKFLSANFQKNFKSKLYHIENPKTRVQTV